MKYDTVRVRWSGGEKLIGTPAGENSREGFLEDSSLTSESQAQAYGEQWLAMHTGTVDQVDLTLEPAAELRPWTGVSKGDALTTDDRDGAPQRNRVLGVGFTRLRRNGVPAWTFTVGSAAQQQQIVAQRQVSKLAEGSMRGSFGSASQRIAPSFGDLPTSALERNKIPVADTDVFVAADNPFIDPEQPNDRTNPYRFDDAEALIRVECSCESLVGSDDSVVDIYRVAFSDDGTEIAADPIDTFTWPGPVRRFTYVTELLFLKGQGIQFRIPAGGAGAHRLITMQPISSSPN